MPTIRLTGAVVLNLLMCPAAVMTDSRAAAGASKLRDSVAVATDWTGDISSLETSSQNRVDTSGELWRVAGSGDVGNELLPSTDEELRLTMAISAQSKAVAAASRSLRRIQGKINETLDMQEDARYAYNLAARVAQRVVDWYQEKELFANASQSAIGALKKDALALEFDLRANTTTADLVTQKLADEKDRLAEEAATLSALNESAEKAKQDFIAADDKAAQIAELLENRSDDLQKAMEKLNDLNNELVKVEEAADKARELALQPSPSLAQVAAARSHRRRSPPPPSKTPLMDEDNLTRALHEQAELVANLTNEVSTLSKLANLSMLDRNQAEIKYQVAQALADSATMNSTETNDLVGDLQSEKWQVSKSIFSDKVTIQRTQAELNETRLDFEKLMQEVFRGRDVVQRATDDELQAEIQFAQANVTLAALQSVLLNETSHLQEAVDNLNLLNDQLKQVQDALQRSE